MSDTGSPEPLVLFVNERVIEKYGRVRCINIFADYGFCVFHLWKSIFNLPKVGRHSETHQDPKACHCGEVFSTSEGLKEHKRAKHEFRYSCTECPNPVIFASKSGLLGHTRKYHSSVFKVENVYNSEADPGFQVRGGGALKKIAPSGGRRENFWGISCEKSRFYAKKSYFFKF